MNKSEVNHTRRVIVRPSKSVPGQWRYVIMAANNRHTGTMGETMGKEHAIEAAKANAPAGVPVYLYEKDGTVVPL